MYREGGTAQLQHDGPVLEGVAALEAEPPVQLLGQAHAGGLLGKVVAGCQREASVSEAVGGEQGVCVGVVPARAKKRESLL